MITIHGQTVTDIRNKIISALIHDPFFIKALAVKDEDFLLSPPTLKEQAFLDHPERLVGSALYPYRTLFSEGAPLVPAAVLSAERISPLPNTGIQGSISVTFYAPVSLNYTKYGLRADYLADRAEYAILNASVLGLRFSSRGDLYALDHCAVHQVSFEISN